jgi:hypothetical protein
MRQYSHAKAIRPDKLELAVNAMMTEGWEPLAGPQWDFNGNQWIQAMVRETQNGNGDVRLKEPKRK